MSQPSIGHAYRVTVVGPQHHATIEFHDIIAALQEPIVSFDNNPLDTRAFEFTAYDPNNATGTERSASNLVGPVRWNLMACPPRSGPPIGLELTRF